MRYFTPILGALFGWCFAEAYLTGPSKHREVGRQEAMMQAVEKGYAHLENGKPVWNVKVER